MNPRRALLGAVVLALVAAAVASLYWIACYEVRVCPGDRQTYVSSAVAAILALYALALIYVVQAKLKPAPRPG